MVDSSRATNRFVAIAMYYLPLPWALDETVALIPFPSAGGWSLLYDQFPSRNYWIVYALLLGLFGIVPWTIGNPLKRGVFEGWRDFFVHLFLGYAIALALTLGWMLILRTCGLLGPLPLHGETVEFAILTLWYVPPLWAPVIGAFLVIRRGRKNNNLT
jgi:hypothetical protein